MIELNVLKNSITITERESITSGSVNVYHVHFHFSSHWDGLEKVAVFRTPTKVINVPIENNICVVPWEVTTTPNVEINVGVYGIKASDLILPTIWVKLATVIEGVFIGDAEAGDHTPDVYDAILTKLYELMNYVTEIRDDVNAKLDDIPSDDEIYMVVDRYLKENPPDIDPSLIEIAVRNYFSSNPIETITTDQVNDLIKQYLANNQVGITDDQVNNLIKQYLTNNQVGVTEQRVQEMINQSVGAAISTGY